MREPTVLCYSCDVHSIAKRGKRMSYKRRMRAALEQAAALAALMRDMT